MFPPLVPALDLELHFVLCDFGALGSAYVETDPTKAGRDVIIRNMIAGEYDRPLHVIAVNPAKGWARDVSGRNSSSLDRDRSARRPIITTRHTGFRGKSARQRSWLDPEILAAMFDRATS